VTLHSAVKGHQDDKTFCLTLSYAMADDMDMYLTFHHSSQRVFSLKLSANEYVLFYIVTNDTIPSFYFFISLNNQHEEPALLKN